jgi:hypothetical protein
VLEARLLMQGLGARDTVALDMEMPAGLPRRAMRLMRAQAASLFDGRPISHGDAVDRWLLRRTLRGGIEPPARRIHRGVAMAQLLALTRCPEARRRFVIGLGRSDYLRSRGAQLRSLVLGR